MIFLILVMDVSLVVQREDRPAMTQPREAECHKTVILITQELGPGQVPIPNRHGEASVAPSRCQPKRSRRWSWHGRDFHARSWFSVVVAGLFLQSAWSIIRDASKDLSAAL